MDTYLRNTWYVAAWSGEVADEPLGRRLLDEPVVFYRKADGVVAALQDRCPHRFVPLSRGKVVGDELRCGYHGLCFDAQGECVDERFNENIRAASKVRSYPVEERYGAIWIWMGEQEADRSAIPDVSFLVDAERDQVFDYQPVKANYTLELDNLLDLSHLDYVHLSTISNGSFTDGEFKVWQDGEKVYSNWFTPDCPIPRQFVAYIVGAERVDQWADVTWTAPCYVHIYSGATRCDDERDNGYWIDQAHFLTPETATSTHYFWGVARSGAKTTAEALEGMKSRLRHAFIGEDAAMLEAQQSAMKGVDFWAERPVVLPEDGGAIRMRRILERLVRNEQPKLEQEPALAAD